MLKRSIAVLLIGMMVISLFLSGCGDGNGDTGKEQQTENTVSDSSSAGQNTEQGDQQPEPGMVKILSIDTPLPGYDIYTAPVIKEIEKRLNIKIELQLLPYNGYEDALQVRIASGSDMPDIFVSDALNPDVLGANGVVVPLNQYFDTHMKNLKKVLDSDEQMRLSSISPDGNMYFVPGRVRAEDNLKMWLIRNDWLKMLNLEVPVTTEDLYNVLKAFKERDPNGNGIKDEIPTAFAYVSYTWFFMMQSFGMNLAVPWDYLGMKDGSFYNYLLKPEMKETIEYLNRLYSDKLFNSDFMNVVGDDFAKHITSNKVGLLFDSAENVASYLKEIKDANPGVEPEWKAILPPKGPRGESGIRVYCQVLPGRYIAAKGDNKEDAMRLMDYLAGDPEGLKLQQLGIENQTYKIENGKALWTDYVLKNPEGLSPEDVKRVTGIDLYFYPCNRTLIEMPEALLEPWQSEGKKLYIDNFELTGEVPYRLTEAQTNEVNDIKNKVNDYINETLSKMIIGNKPISDWNEFTDELKRNNIDRITEIYQSIYDGISK